LLQPRADRGNLIHNSAFRNVGAESFACHFEHKPLLLQKGLSFSFGFPG
jgi:hypothetical protein